MERFITMFTTARHRIIQSHLNPVHNRTRDFYKIYFNIILTEQTGVAVKLQARIQDILGLTRDRDTGYSEALCGLPQYLQENAALVHRFGHDLILPNPLQLTFRRSYYHLTLLSL
jgi:hypothetical protein